MAIDSTRNSLRLDCNNNRVQVFRASDSTFPRNFGSQGSKDGQFNEPKGITIDSTTDTLFVMDYNNHRVQVFRASDGTFLRKFGSQGSGDGQFNGPNDVEIDSTTDTLFISDIHNHRVQVFRMSDGSSSQLSSQLVAARTPTESSIDRVSALREVIAEAQIEVLRFETTTTQKQLAQTQTELSITQRKRDEIQQESTQRIFQLETQVAQLPPTSSSDDAKGIATHWMYPQEQVIIGEPSGSGAFGQVFAGLWLGTPVALKRTHLLDPTNPEMAALVREMSEPERDGLVQTFWKECHVTARLRHPNIVLFLGVIVDSLITPPHPLFLMMEYIGGGTLHQLLYSSSISTTSTSSSSSSSEHRLSEERKRQILLDIARGLRYLHSQKPPILHLDIKPANILMTPEGRAKLGDFGEAHIIQSSSTLRKRQTMTSPGTFNIFGVGTLDYMAPEMYIEDEIKTPKVDMFSFGVLVAEVGAEKPPNPGANLIMVSGRIEYVPEPERRKSDIAAVPSPRLRKLVSHLILDDPELRWNAKQVIDFFFTIS